MGERQARGPAGAPIPFPLQRSRGQDSAAAEPAAGPPLDAQPNAPLGPRRHLRLLTQDELILPGAALGTVSRLSLSLSEADPLRRATELRATRAPELPVPPKTAPAPAAVSLRTPAAARGRRGLRLGERLIRTGALKPADLAEALDLQKGQESRLGEILVARGFAGAAEVNEALAAQWRAEEVDLTVETPDPAMLDALGAERCLALGILPLRRVGAATLVATAHPEEFEAHRPELEATLGRVIPALASGAEIAQAIARLRGTALAAAAERRTPDPVSCRTWRGAPTGTLALLAMLGFAAALVAAPIATLWAMTAVVMVTLVATTALKGLALGQLIHDLRRQPESPAPQGQDAEKRLPCISIFVPLFEETEIASTLLSRLDRLQYPKELTDILLLVEQSDGATRQALAGCDLPAHIRALVVPPGTVMTKPRALNYGLAFARGEIVGIWDAEDAPDPDQLAKVARGFAAAPPRVVCLQGALDYYNARTNWLSRCFTLEYGTWFRGFLPGLQGLDLPIPLGGTTLFFRRSVLEEIGAWDAHNVTEDADLGIRLYREGWRTPLLDTTTKEEANCRPVNCIKQRSRWLKGYAITWAVHMRQPRRLWRQMGARGFWGFNTLFLGTLVQFVLTPVLLSFWLLWISGLHPLSGQVPVALGWVFLALMLACEAISLMLTLVANRARERRWLWWWIPTLQFYYPLAALAAYKGLWELIARPFYWDKTQHGLHSEDVAQPDGSPGEGGPGEGGGADPGPRPGPGRPVAAR